MLRFIFVRPCTDFRVVGASMWCIYAFFMHRTLGYKYDFGTYISYYIKPAFALPCALWSSPFCQDIHFWSSHFARTPFSLPCIAIFPSTLPYIVRFLL